MESVLLKLLLKPSELVIERNSPFEADIYSSRKDEKQSRRFFSQTDEISQDVIVSFTASNERQNVESQDGQLDVGFTSNVITMFHQKRKLFQTSRP